MDAARKRWLSRVNMADSMVLTAVFLSAAYWALEALINLFSPGEISFYREIFGPNAGDMGMRVIVLCLFLIFGSHVQFTINNRKRAEQALRESEEKYRTILESIEEGYYEVGLDGRLRFVNDSTCRILGRARAELLGLDLRGFLADEERPDPGRHLRRVPPHGTGGEGLRVRAAAPRARCSTSRAPPRRCAVRSGDLAGFRGMLRDRTERKRLEMDLLDSNRKLQHARAATILGLAKLAEYRDEGTGTHLERIREYARMLAEELGRLPSNRQAIDQRFIDDIYQSAILHDIGKVGIPDAVLLKPGELTSEEFEIIKRHTVFGGDAITAIQAQIEGRTFLNLGREIAYNHHEKWDGSGYPCGLRADAIPLAARIVAVADVYDALTTRRFYKEAFSHAKACHIIRDLKGSHFDPEVVEAFLTLEDQFNRVREEKVGRDGPAPEARACAAAALRLTGA